MVSRNPHTTNELARAWALSEAGQFTESPEERLPCDVGLSCDDAILMHIDAAREAHLIKMGRLDKSSRLERAAKRLAIILASGPKAPIEVRRLAKGFSRATLWRAAKKLGVQVSKNRFDGGWMWEIRRKIEALN